MKRALFYIYSVSGGAGKNFIFVANHLANRGWKVDVSFIAGKKDMLNRFNKHVNLKMLNFQLHTKPGRALLTIVYLFRALFTRRYDCTFSTGYSNNALLIAAAFLSRFKGRVIVRSALSLNAYKKIRPLKYHVVTVCYKLCRWCPDVCLISLNADMHAEVNKLNFGGDNVTKCIIGNPVNVQEIRKKSRAHFNLNPACKNKEIKLFAIGRLVEEKNFFRVFEVVESLSLIYDCILILIGEGPLYPDLSRYVKKRGLEKSVILAGYQENPYPIISNCDIMLSTSTAEGMPNAILESIALGKPIVALDCKTGPREILERYKAGYLVKEDRVAAYIKAIHKLIEKRQFVGKPAVEKLENDLSMESIGFDYTNLFSDFQSVPR